MGLKEEYQHLCDLIEKYSDLYYVNIEVSKIYALFPEDNLEELILHAWPEKWPYAEQPGVYVVFDEKGKVIYIGKTSMKGNIGSRLSSYFGHVDYPDDQRCKVKHDSWSTTPFYIVTAAVSRAYEAASMEEYLIMQIKPVDNTLTSDVDGKQ